jgi:uncharacterized protein YjbJ (UPF0337 family)
VVLVDEKTGEVIENADSSLRSLAAARVAIAAQAIDQKIQLRSSTPYMIICFVVLWRASTFRKGQEFTARSQAQGNFKQVKGKIKQQWGKLTDDEIDQMEGNAEILVGKLQERYSWDRAEAERQAREFQNRENWH